MDLSQMSVMELQKLALEIPKELERRQAAERQQIADELQEFIAARGLKVSEVAKLLAAKPPRTRQTVAPKYRHPTDANLTWTGRGKRPVWVTQWLESGGTLDGVRIHLDQ